jgi:type VI secretion system protein ImpM
VKSWPFKVAQDTAGPPQALPGWFGKLPGIGDFAHRRLPAPFQQGWDNWLQEGLAGLRARHAGDWPASYLASPLWCFALGAGTVDANPWIGVLMPSVDGVGRYFPFTLARVFDDGIDEFDWWAHAADTALEALDTDLDAERFEALLAQRFTPPATPGSATPPPPGQSAWHAGREDGTNQRFTLAGLPRGTCFDALFQTAPLQEPLS